MNNRPAFPSQMEEMIAMPTILDDHSTTFDLTTRVDTEATATPIGTRGESEREGSHADRLVALAEQSTKLFHSPDEQVYAVFGDGSSPVAWSLDSRKFRRWLSHAYFSEYKMVPSQKAIQDAINVLAGTALFNGIEHEVFVRVAEFGGTIYYDLGDEDDTIVEIDGAGWRVADRVPVKFVRPSSMLAQVMPEHGGSVELLKRYLNVAEEDIVLVLGWFMAALTPSGPKPVLGLHGEQGSAKSTTTRVLKRLVDPTKSELRAEPHGVQALMIAARNEWLPTFDNMSGMSPWLSDAFCRIATGSSMTTREFYTNLDEVIIDVRRPLILNGIGEVATRPDLLSRSIILNLPTITDGERRTEEEFWREFERDRPTLLGFLFDSLSVALRRLPTTVLPSLPRMSDFAKLATAAEEAWGVEPGTFMAAYTRSQEEASGLVVESSPVAQAILTLVEREITWEGTPGGLLGRLNRIDAESRAVSLVPQAVDWPKNARALSVGLKRLAPVLRTHGVEVVLPRPSNGQRLMKVGKAA
jgi:hypothetical protein